MRSPILVDFDATQAEMIHRALVALERAGYETSALKELVRVDMPKGYRAMTLAEGAALGPEAFASQDWLNHVLEEEYLHLMQKSQGLTEEYQPGTALELELGIDDLRKFPAPGP